ncbi:MAG: aminoacyl-tRNA hydrolase [Pirellulales bacterium]|nr:aminoacyl-tRNA hydrolase [Pirellulales bacterium]
MKLIVGLGNPGRKYEQTRHNVGFMAVAKLAALISASPSKARFEGEVAEGALDGEKLLVLCPHTFMNASGKSVRKACDFYKLSAQDLLVVCDDLNLPCGRLRLRPSGSAGGQKGLADIIRQLGTDSFTRLKIGIDRPPPQWDVSDYVLGKFRKDEQEKIESATTRAAYAAMDWAKQGTSFAMNKYNADPDAAKQSEAKPTQSNQQDNQTAKMPPGSSRPSQDSL